MSTIDFPCGRSHVLARPTFSSTRPWLPIHISRGCPLEFRHVSPQAGDLALKSPATMIRALGASRNISSATTPNCSRNSSNLSEFHLGGA